jgi:hypothetical protein
MNRMTQRFVMASGVAVAALAAFGPAAAQDGNAIPRTVTVFNDRPVPVVVYLDQGEFDTRLGTVPARSTEVLNLPEYLNEDASVDVIVHPEGGEDLSAGPITLEVGKKLEVLVPTDEDGYIPPPREKAIPEPAAEGTTTVTVENVRDQQVTVFLERGLLDVRVGVVPPHQEETLSIPSSLTGDAKDVEIFFHPEGGSDMINHVFDLKAGEHLVIEVPTH